MSWNTLNSYGESFSGFIEESSEVPQTTDSIYQRKTCQKEVSSDEKAKNSTST